MGTTLPPADLATALEAYKTGTAKEKALLEKLFGKETFAVDLTASFEEACKITGDNPLTVLPYASPKDAEEEVANAQRALRIHAKAMKIKVGAKDPDWNKRSEAKWYPVFDMEVSESNPSGGRFLGSNYDCDDTVTTVGSRLSFPTKELSDTFGTQNLALHKIVLTTK